MQTKYRNLILSVLVFTAVPAGLTWAQEAPAPAAATPFDKCLKAVNLRGASMGHTETKDAQGRPAFRFTLRTSGMDYVAICDAQSGMIHDVSPKPSGGPSPL